MTAMIQTQGLTKHFGSNHAVNGLSLEVSQGEIYGFLGLNGAGKTTTIRMLLGMIRPDSGSSYISGQRVDAGSHKLWSSVGYMVETPYSYPELTVRENLEMIRRLRGIADRKAVDSIIGRLQLTAYRDRKAGTLSLGNGQRLGLAKAMLHHPKVLILDEPTNGLDPAGIVEVRELLRGLALNHGVTVFISSHILGEISRLTTRIGIVHQGRLLQETDVSNLQHLLRKQLLVETREPAKSRDRLIQAGFKVRVSGNGTMLLRDEQAITHPDHISKLLAYANMPPTMIRVEEEDLEAYFLRMIEAEGGVAK
ncbi:ABC transporter ATP-binding protein [Paenibacillus sp. MMS20-IR301]|uniref:ABC transporter ATP-binding protein n=1 Tax=Paenibacillus sp. MMS20-IR301 TaxID=2895946 RepID=UPI0028F14A2A|nr:ABC transporter ATP-binding protein [Paenibacillus sp. MMS20-IR301]WNS42393.1 ABC transporter ATP-binding protein [Paenibacillus sp. MMS20-IR301]